MAARAPVVKEGKHGLNRFDWVVRGASVVLFALAISFKGDGQEAKPGQQAKPAMAAIQALIRSKQYDQALQRIDAALKQTPTDVRLWTLDGIVLSLEGKTAGAIDAFDRALKIVPGYPAALKGEVQLYYQTHDLRAIPLLEQLAKANPEDETAQEMLGVLEGRQGHCDAADGHFLRSTKAIAEHPESLEAYGGCLMQEGEYEKAVPVFTQLVALLPERTYAKYDLAVALVSAKREAEAVQVLAPLVAAEPNDPEVLSLASDAYESTGDTPKAVSLLRQAIVLAPANAAYYTSFAGLCLNHDSFQVGIDMIDAGMTRIQKNSSLYIARGMLYAQLAQYDKAEADFKTAEGLDAGQSLSAYASDLAALQKNNPEQALTQIRTQLKAHPDSALLLYLQAKVLSTQSNDTDSKTVEEATRSANAALKLNPTMTEARDLLASLYTRSGQYELAVEQSRLVLRSDPKDQTAIYHLITALRHAGQAEHREEIQGLVKQLAELQKTARESETDRKRFKFEEQAAPVQ